MKYELHPLCTLFPRLGAAEFDQLVADIKANGLREPITLCSGMILDGGNRYSACLAASIEPRFVPFGGTNLVEFVLSMNLRRRHLTVGQQAAIVAIAQDWAKAQPASRPEKAGNVAGLSTVADRAVQSGASDRTQRMADKVAKADPALARQVAHGEVSLPTAVRQVDAAAAAQPAPKAEPRSPTQPAKTTAHQQAQEDAYGGMDPLDELERANNELKALHEQIAAMSADDQKAETLKWRLAYDNAVRQQSEAMDRAKQATDREAWTMRQLRRCGKAIGQDDPSKIAAAVEALALHNKKVVVT